MLSGGCSLQVGAAPCLLSKLGSHAPLLREEELYLVAYTGILASAVTRYFLLGTWYAR